MRTLGSDNKQPATLKKIEQTHNDSTNSSDGKLGREGCLAQDSVDVSNGSG